MTKLKSELGQVFTPDSTVKQMLALRRHFSRTLEPSVGSGQFWHQLKGDKVGIEIDPDHCPSNVLCADFFDYPLNEKFQTIIGNPPYVQAKSIIANTRGKLNPRFDKRTNLYIHFIDKCIDHLSPAGELIFIVPRDFLKATSAIPLNKRLWEEGRFTFLEETGDQKIFHEASPNCVIFRWVKDPTLPAWIENLAIPYSLHHGHFVLGETKGYAVLGDYFDIKVGGVSGADEIFTHPQGNCAFVNSKTRTTGALKTMFYNMASPALEPYRETLLQRKIKTFKEDTWFTWGRNSPTQVGPRIYVNMKTRTKDPFFMSDHPYFDGSILGLFPKKAEMDLHQWMKILNEMDWQNLGFYCDGRYIFGQRSLEKCPIVV